MPIVNPGKPSGGTTPGASIVRGPFSFAFDTAGLNNGHAVYTPTVGDLILDAWIEVTTAFDGTTPLGDIGTFNGGADGWIGSQTSPVDLSVADRQYPENAGGTIEGNTPTGSASGVLWALLVQNVPKRTLPIHVTAANPVLIVVSQDGTKGGTAIGGTHGAGNVYLVTATPTSS